MPRLHQRNKLRWCKRGIRNKRLQFKTVCKDDTGYLTQLKQQQPKNNPASHRLNVNALLSNTTFWTLCFVICEFIVKKSTVIR